MPAPRRSTHIDTYTLRSLLARSPERPVLPVVEDGRHDVAPPHLVRHLARQALLWLAVFSYNQHRVRGRGFAALGMQA